MARTRRRLITVAIVASVASAIALVRHRRLAAATEEFQRRYGAT